MPFINTTKTVFDKLNCDIYKISLVAKYEAQDWGHDLLYFRCLLIRFWVLFCMSIFWSPPLRQLSSAALCNTSCSNIRLYWNWNHFSCHQTSSVGIHALTWRIWACSEYGRFCARYLSWAGFFLLLFPLKYPSSDFCSNLYPDLTLINIASEFQ